ncbi:hypothetical protein YPPY66_1346, partial [Yersinia pestis PY-66]
MINCPSPHVNSLSKVCIINQFSKLSQFVFLATEDNIEREPDS